jgi:hypothetical protein
VEMRNAAAYKTWLRWSDAASKAMETLSAAVGETWRGWSDAAWEARGHGRAAAKNMGRRAVMPSADSMGTMEPHPVATAPAVPAIRSAPTQAVIPLVTAGVPAGSLPASVVPTIIAVFEGIVLDCLDRR